MSSARASRPLALFLTLIAMPAVVGCSPAVAPPTAGPTAAASPSPSAAGATTSPAESPTTTPDASAAITVRDGEPWISYQASSPRGDGDTVFLIRPDGTDRHALVPDLDGEDFHPDWSPDGSRIAFIHYAPGERSELWVVDADGTNATKLVSCTAPCNTFNYPDWAPDGSAIYYGWDADPRPGGPPSTFGVGRYDVATGEAIDVLTRKDGMTAEQPRVSPDGTRVVYDRGDILGAGPGIALFVSDLEGGPERQLTDWTTMAAHPDWVSDDRLIFNSYDLGFFQDTEEASNLYSVAADGSDLQQLTTFGRSDTRATQPRMTPDGSAIVFTRVDGDGYGRRTGALIDLDGTNLRELTPKEIFATHSQLRPTPPS
jgi:Tol biopolymer transport system component